MEIEKLDGTLLLAMRNALHLNVATICKLLRKPITVRTWQKYECGQLNIPEKVVEDVFEIAFRYHKIKSSGEPISYAKSLDDWLKMDLKTDNSFLDWKMHQAIFCSEIIDSIVFTIKESDGKLPRVSKISKADIH